MPRSALRSLLPRLALLLAAGVTACAVAPIDDRRQPAPLTEAEEIRLGQDGDLEIRRQFAVYENQALQAYVQQVGERLAANSHRPQLKYTFTVLDSPEVNSFALPGGYIYITRGMLAHLNSEAELAAVLAHDIGHVAARHAVRRYSETLAANAGAAAGAIGVPEPGARTAPTPVGAIGGALVGGYGREHELEAHHLGAEYLARSGYGPQTLLAVLDLLGTQQRFDHELAAREHRKPRAYHGVLAVQPDADPRLQEIVTQADKSRTEPGGRVERDAYLRRLAGLPFGDSAAQGVRSGNAFYHQGLGFAVRFPEGWLLDNTPERLLAHHPDGSALFEMQVTPRGAARTPQEYLVVNMQLRDLRDTRAFQVGTLPAYAAVSRLQTPYGPRDTRVAVVFRDRHAYRFFGAAHGADGLPAEQQFLDSVRSLRALRPAERAIAGGLRLEVVTAKRGDRFAKLARRTPLKTEPEGVLRVLNNRYPAGEPAAGELIKVIR